MIVDKMYLLFNIYLWEPRKEESWWIRAKSFAKGHLAVELAASITIGTKMPTFGPKESYPTTPPRANTRIPPTPTGQPCLANDSSQS